ncbi:hypothetical protein AGMMS49965_24990 [Bacteroidia bacterium]|nr:hypothetical protein AGMMS49965_24990 [Bacteroidia bacterium]
MGKELLIREIERVDDPQLIDQLFDYMIFMQINGSRLRKKTEALPQKKSYSLGLPIVHPNFDTTEYISQMREEREFV